MSLIGIMSRCDDIMLCCRSDDFSDFMMRTHRYNISEPAVESNQSIINGRNSDNLMSNYGYNESKLSITAILNLF